MSVKSCEKLEKSTVALTRCLFLNVMSICFCYGSANIRF